MDRFSQALDHEMRRWDRLIERLDELIDFYRDLPEDDDDPDI